MKSLAAGPFAFGLGSLSRWWQRWSQADLTSRNLRILYLDTALVGVVSGGIGTFISVFLVRLDAPYYLIGLLTASPALVAMIFTVPLSGLLRGRRDVVRIAVWGRLLLRLCYFAVAAVPFFLAGEPLAFAVVALWALSALPDAIGFPAWLVTVAGIVPPSIRPRVNSVRWALLSIVSAVAVAIFGWLLDQIIFPINYQLVFFVSVAIGMGGVYLFGLLRLPPDWQPERATQSTPGIGQPLRLGVFSSPIWQYRGYTRFIVSAFVYRIGLYLPQALFAIFWVQDLHASDTWIGLRTTAGNGALVFAYLAWGQIAIQRGNRLVLLISTAGLALYPILTGMVYSVELLVPVALVWGIFAAGLDIAFFEAMLRSCPADLRGIASAVNTATANAAMFAAPMLGTTLAGIVGSRPTLMLSGIISLVGWLLFYRLAVARETGPEAEAIASG